MRSKRFAVLALSAVLALTLWGCGSSRDGGNIASGEGTSLATAQTVGINNCVTCHANYQAVKDWNDPTNPHAYNTHYSHFSDPICVTCHDSTGDGHLLPETPFAGLNNDPVNPTIPTLAQALEERPVVGCEACHGGGQYHRGVGPIPYPTPDPDRCGQCHDKQWDSSPLLTGHKTTYHVQGYGILTDYKASKHGNSIEAHNYASGSTTDVRASCSRCHTDQGVRKYKDVTGTEAQVDEALANEPNVANASPVQCRTCHNPHNTSKLLQADTVVADANGTPVLDANGNQVTIDAEVSTCTTCHQRYGASHHGEGSTYSWSGHAIGSGTFNGRVIYDTHKIMAPIVPLDPTAADVDAYVQAPGALNTNVVLDGNGDAIVTGYAINPNETNGRGGSAHGSNMGPCADCHNVHSADNTINDEWEHSAHAGHLGQAKDSVTTEGPGAPLAQFEAGTSEGPFAGSHDFAQPGEVDCQHCHTSTGAKNYLNDPVAYNSAVLAFKADQALATPTGVPSPNDYSYLGDLTNPTHGREMIQCWACHDYNQGSLRAPGAIKVTYLDSTGTEVTFPDDGDSNVCISCHTGRNNGQNIKDNFDATKNFGSYNSHYLSAAGTIYKTTGYEFTGQDYSNPAYYEHDLIGVNDYEGTGTRGPCVTCHMQDDATGHANHRYSPFELDANNEPIDNTPSQICAVCHNGTHAWTPAKFAVQADGYAQALTVLADTLAANGIYYGPGYPYFYSDAALTTRYTGWANADTLGAAFNLNLLKNEPGAFAHNRYYAKRLIFDSLDYLDNGTLDGTITIDPLTYPDAATWFGADATTGVATRP